MSIKFFYGSKNSGQKFVQRQKNEKKTTHHSKINTLYSESKNVNVSYSKSFLHRFTMQFEIVTNISKHFYHVVIK